MRHAKVLSKLRRQRFAVEIAVRKLLGCNDSYYSFNTNCRQLKLKKDYINRLENNTNLAIIKKYYNV